MKRYGHAVDEAVDESLLPLVGKECIARVAAAGLMGVFEACCLRGAYVLGRLRR